MRMRRTRRGIQGQSMIEYAVLVAAVSLGVIAAANWVYRSFTGQARRIEDTQVVF